MNNHLDFWHDKQAYSAVGRRKTAVAKVRLVRGTGSVLVNNKPLELYLQFNAQYINDVKAPLLKLGLESACDIYVNTHGGGIRGQADAIKLGISRALCKAPDNKNRSSLKTAGYLTCDARCKERKKYGLRKARKAPQFSKR